MGMHEEVVGAREDQAPGPGEPHVPFSGIHFVLHRAGDREHLVGS